MSMKQCMYIGPSISGVIKTSTIFIVELPARLNKLIEELPCVRNLIVPIDRLTRAKQALSEQGSVENVSYHQILDYKEGEKTNVNI